MYLKEIRTVGFKSFADRTTFLLDKGITGIVGPNGSGKSNVVDAVRWVLGEQSIKELRGESAMSDIIFSGSKSRKSLNSASVTLVFDNTDKYLGTEYTEISVKRRVYRNGENEYFLNNTKCRLKDITNLFVDSGASKGSYNIISQGKVGEIVTSKPQDRRVIFEEAAGVLKYKKRKEDAIRKLKRTHDNLDRINDIINELEIQINPLKEQSEKATEYLLQKEELEKVEIALISNDIEKINSDYEASKIKIEAINSDIMNIDTGTNVNEVKLDEKRIKLDQIEKDLAQAQGALIELTSLVEKLDGKKKIAIERKQYDVEDIKLHNNAILLKEKEMTLNNDIDLVKVDIELKERELKSVISNIDDLDERIKKVKMDKDLIINDLTYKSRKEAEINHKIELLEHSIENNSLLPSGVKAVLNNPRLDGVYDVIANLIDVNKEYVKAIEISLGAAASFIVCDNDKNAKEAIKYLKKDNMGRATFFPVSVIKNRKINDGILSKLKNAEGFIDLAVNLATFDPKFVNVIGNQLGSVVIAESLNDAYRISKEIEHRYKVVTLEGEVVHIGGSLTGGNARSRRGILNENYELEKAIYNKKTLVKDIKVLEEKINELDTKIGSMNDELYLKNSSKINFNEVITSKKQVLSSHEERLEATLDEIKGIDFIRDNNLDEEEARIIEEYYGAINEKEKKVKFIESLNNEKNIIKDDIEKNEFELKQNNSEFNKKQQELKNLEININRMEVKLDNLLMTLNEEYNMTFEKAREMYHLEIKEDIARVKVNNIKSIIKRLGMVNIAAIEEYERVNTRYEFLTSQKEDLYKAETTLLEIIKDMDEVMKYEFSKTFEIVKVRFGEVFKELFGGGKAELKLTDPGDLLGTGVEIIAQPPGKKLQHLSLLSGGEKTLTAISLLFAILRTRPVPFSILDEVEAALDEVNADNFGKYLRQFKDRTQFIVITHKKKTMEFVDTLYGITMQESGVSKLVSVKLDEIEEKR